MAGSSIVRRFGEFVSVRRQFGFCGVPQGLQVRRAIPAFDVSVKGLDRLDQIDAIADWHVVADRIIATPRLAVRADEAFGR